MGKGRGMTTTKQKTTKRLVSVLAAALALFAFTERAEAQQILLTGPLAGAPAVRKLRWHRKGRFEVAPAVSFTWTPRPAHSRAASLPRSSSSRVMDER